MHSVWHSRLEPSGFSNGSRPYTRQHQQRLAHIPFEIPAIYDLIEMQAFLIEGP